MPLPPKIRRGDRWATIPDIVNALIDVVTPLVNSRPGPGLAKTAQGNLCVIPMGSIGQRDNSGGSLLTLDSSNPTTTWARDTDLRPVRYDGPYTKWDGTNHKFVFVSRPVQYDRGGNLVSIGAEHAVDIVSAEGCTS